MKKKIFMVKSFARNVKVENHDLRRDYGLCHLSFMGCSSNSSWASMPTCSMRWQLIW